MRAGLSPSKAAGTRSTCAADALDPAARPPRPRSAARSADLPLGRRSSPVAPPTTAIGVVPGLLEATHGDELDEVAEVERRRGGVEAAVEGHRPGRHGGPRARRVGGMRDHPRARRGLEQVGSAGGSWAAEYMAGAPLSVPRGRLAATRATLRPRWPAGPHLRSRPPARAPSAAAPLRPQTHAAAWHRRRAGAVLMAFFAVAALASVHRHRCRVFASYTSGLPDVVEARELRAGQGSTRHLGRRRRARHASPPRSGAC